MPTPDGVIVLLPAVPGAPWHWCAVAAGALGEERQWAPGEDVPWEGGTQATALVPAEMAPVTDSQLPDLPVAQALAAARISAGRGELEEDRHVAVAAQDGRLLTAVTSPDLMDGWLATLVASGLSPRAIVPAALCLPRPDEGALIAELGGQTLVRTPHAAFTGEAALIDALAEQLRAMSANEIEAALLALHASPALDLRQGRYAPRRVSYFTVADWLPLARLAANAALLALLAMLTIIVRLDLDASAREQQAVAKVQQRFPSAVDLDTAERLVTAASARQGAGAQSFSAPMAALLSAISTVPGVAVRDIAFDGLGSLRFTAAAARAEDINTVLRTLQHQGWKVTVPPSLAPDPTGATVAAITLRAE